MYYIDIFVYNYVFGFISSTNIHYLLTGLNFKLSAFNAYYSFGYLWAYNDIIS